MINIKIITTSGTERIIEADPDEHLSLMETLIRSDFDIPATCGGIALCATCHVQVKSGNDSLPPAYGQELDMLDILPDSDWESRLACQLRVTQAMDGMVFKLQP